MSIRHELAVNRLRLKLLQVTFFCILLCWLGQRELQAQQIIIRGTEDKLEVYKQFKNLLEGKCAAAKNRIKSHLLDIDRVCELSPKQRTRLEVAGKGAVVSYTDKIAKEFQQQAKNSGFEFNRGNPPEEDPDDDDENFAQRGARVVDLGGGPNGKLEFTIDTEKIWINSVKKTLTETQTEKLELWTIAREKMIRQAAVDHFIAKANLKMFLSRDQIQKLKTYVDRKYGLQLLQQMKMPPKQNRNMFLVVPQPNRDIEVDDSLKELLSEPQLEIWKTDFQEDLDSLEDG